MFTDIQQLKDLMGNNDASAIAKALTVASGFVGINLEPTAKLMLPLYAGLRNRLPVDTPRVGGQQAIWRMQLGYGGFDFAANQGTTFAGIGGALAGNAVTIQADYKTQAINGAVDFEAIPMARGFDDPLAIETSRGLATLVKLDELLVLGANEAAIAAPGTPTVGNSGVAGAAFGVGNWSAQVAAVTLQGILANTGADSHTGESAVSATATTAVAAGGATYLTASWGAVAGAVGYKVYANAVVGGGASTFLVKKNQFAYSDGGVMTNDSNNFVTVNNVRITSAPSNLNQTPPGADGSANTNVYEGLISWAEKSTIYGQAVGSKISIDQGGLKLTTTGSGVKEFDVILRNLWTTWQISPTLIVGSALSASNLTDQLVAANSNFMYRVDIGQERGRFTGGVYVGGYLNKFVASMLGNTNAVIPVWAHPYIPDGTFLFLTERIPYTYSREARGFALDVMQPYTYFDLARTTRNFPFSLFFMETLKCYHPLAQGTIQGVRVE